MCGRSQTKPGSTLSRCVPWPSVASLPQQGAGATRRRLTCCTFLLTRIIGPLRARGITEIGSSIPPYLVGVYGMQSAEERCTVATFNYRDVIHSIRHHETLSGMCRATHKSSSTGRCEGRRSRNRSSGMRVVSPIAVS